MLPEIPNSLTLLTVCHQILGKRPSLTEDQRDDRIDYCLEMTEEDGDNL